MLKGFAAVIGAATALYLALRDGPSEQVIAPPVAPEHAECKTDDDCSNVNACDGQETCDVSTGTCRSGNQPNCDDGDACTADSCDATAGCRHDLIDGDSDGFSPYSCAPGAPHNGDDCLDSNAKMYPGQTGFFALPAFNCDPSKPCPEDLSPYDYDCDGTVEKQFPFVAPNYTCTPFPECLGGGWTELQAPACGESGDLARCVNLGEACGVAFPAIFNQACR